MTSKAWEQGFAQQGICALGEMRASWITYKPRDLQKKKAEMLEILAQHKSLLQESLRLQHTFGNACV